MLILILFFSTLLLNSCLSQLHAKNRVKRIVNGQRAEKIPYQVSIELNDYHLCGGSIISENLVLTAAHCLDVNYKNDYSIRVGTNQRHKGGQLIKVKEFLVHPKFKLGFIDNDIGVIILETPITFNGNVSAIPLPNENSKPHLERKSLISGWGYESEDSAYLAENLMFAFVNVLDPELCRIGYSEFSDHMICAGEVNGGTDACNRDSGGPLVQDNKLIGVISAGVGCGQNRLPGIYTNVAYYKNWIENATKQYTIAEFSGSKIWPPTIKAMPPFL